MGRAGVPPGTALTISLLGFLGTMVALVGMGLYTLAATPTHPGGLPFAGSVGSLGLVAAGMLAAGLWPDGVRACLGCLTRGLWRLAGRSARLEPWWPPTDPRSGPPLDHLPGAAAALADLVYTYRADVGRFLRLGKRRFVAVCLLSLVFFFARCACGSWVSRGRASATRWRGRPPWSSSCSSPRPRAEPGWPRPSRCRP